MEQNFGSQLAFGESKKGNKFFSFIGVLLSAWYLINGLLIIVAYFFFGGQLDGLPVVLTTGAISIAIAVAIFLIFSFLSKKFKPKHTTTVYEQGVIIERKKEINKFHFNQIKGLKDRGQKDSSAAAIGVAFGVIGGLIAGLMSGSKKSQLREISVMDNSSKLFNVADAASEDLSQAYTNWLVKEKNITQQNINDIQLSFGDNLELKNGTFILKHKRNDKNIKLADITRFETLDNNNFSIFGLNEKNKEKAIIQINVQNLLNMDLITKIIEISKS